MPHSSYTTSPLRRALLHIRTCIGTSFIGLSISLPAHTARAQATTGMMTMLPAVHTATTAGPDVLTIVPFALEDNRILFEVEFDGIRGTYVFDTGAPFIAFSAQYIRPGKRVGPFPTIDTVPTSVRHTSSPQGSGDRHEALQSLLTLRQMTIGTLTQVLPPTDIGPPQPPVESNAVLFADSRYEGFTRPVFGSFGLNAMEPFEIVIDYPQKQLIFIRLDSAGHPLADVPQHTLVGTVSLVPVLPEQYWWGVRASLESPGTTDVLMLDAGSKYNFLTDATLARLSGHVVALSDALSSSGAPSYLLDHLTIGEKTVDDVEIRPFSEQMLGYPFLAQLGVVGFNFRTREFSWYH